MFKVALFQKNILLTENFVISEYARTILPPGGHYI